MIEVGQFAVVQNNNLIEHDIKETDIVYIAGDAIVATSEEDPYALRRILVAAKLIGDSIDVNGGAFTIEGLSLKAVDEVTQKRLDNQKKFDFAKAEDATTN